MRFRKVGLLPVQVWAILGIVGCAGYLRAQGESPDGASEGVLIGGHGYQVPCGPSRGVYRFASDGPAAALRFLEERGREWRIYWDEKLDTPRCLVPLEGTQVASPELLREGGDREALAARVGDFLEGMEPLLGVGRRELGAPFIYSVRKSVVLVFPQTTPGGIEVRGAGLRVVLREDGTLAWIKAFLARGLLDPVDPLLGPPPVDGTLPSEQPQREARLQMVFPDSSLSSVLPTWSREVPDEWGTYSETLTDARTGELIERRRVLKFFDIHGLVLGRSPSSRDIFASPQKGQPELSSLSGLVVRGEEGTVVGFTAEAGLFGVTAESDPATLSVALEHGQLDEAAVDPVQNPAGLVSLLQLKPLDRMLRPRKLSPAEDKNADGIPDITVSGSASEDFLFVFNRDTQDAEYVERAWWLQCYHHAHGMLEVIRTGLQSFELTESPFLPLGRLRILPTLSDGIQSYAGPNHGADGYATIISSTTMEVGQTANQDWILEDAVPTVFRHEVGHHVLRHITGYGEVELEGIEDGLADVLVGFTTGLCQIGYREPAQPSPIGFCLGGEDAFRTAARADVGNAFWLLRELLASEARKDPDPEDDPLHPKDMALGILLHWLAMNHVPARDQKVFDLSDDLIDQLLEVDRMLYGENGFIRSNKPHEELVVDAFRGRKLFDAPFVRGDSNVDRKVDISDAVSTLNFLFGGLGVTHVCKNAMDADDNGAINVTDPIVVLNHLFRGGGPLPAPYPSCGLDPDPPGDPRNLGCFDFSCPR